VLLSRNAILVPYHGPRRSDQDNRTSDVSGSRYLGPELTRDAVQTSRSALAQYNQLQFGVCPVSEFGRQELWGDGAMTARSRPRASSRRTLGDRGLSRVDSRELAAWLHR
jgi:hypothetical protein